MILLPKDLGKSPMNIEYNVVLHTLDLFNLSKHKGIFEEVYSPLNILCTLIVTIIGRTQN